MANTKKQPENKKAEKKQPENKVEMMMNVLANQKKKEADKQKFIYSAMNGMIVVRN